jgi:hypothetical protein
MGWTWIFTRWRGPFVAKLLRVAPTARDAPVKASIIQAAFLAGWAKYERD